MQTEINRIVYEQKKNRLAPVCATCLRRCKLVFEQTYTPFMFHCHGYTPIPSHHNRFKWPGDFIEPGLSPAFIKHFKRYHIKNAD